MPSMQDQPELPRRYMDGSFRRTTSEYGAQYRNEYEYTDDEKRALGVYVPSSKSATTPLPSISSPSSSSAAASSSQLVASRKKPAPARFQHHHFSHFWHETSEEKERVRPEQHSFRLWGRLNPAYAAMPYLTDSQRNYQNYFDQRDKVFGEFAMKVENKAYKEALARQSLTQKELATSSSHVSPSSLHANQSRDVNRPASIADRKSVV